MPRTPHNRPGSPLEEEAWVPQISTSDPDQEGELRCVVNKGWVEFSDGVVRPIGGGSRNNPFQFPVDDRDINIPPVSPTNGDRVIVGSSPSGDFISHIQEIAQWNGTDWIFFVPFRGMIVYVKDENEPYKQISSSYPWSWTRLDSSAGTPDLSKVVLEVNGTFVYTGDGVIVTVE